MSKLIDCLLAQNDQKGLSTTVYRLRDPEFARVFVDTYDRESLIDDIYLEICSWSEDISLVLSAMKDISSCCKDFHACILNSKIIGALMSAVYIAPSRGARSLALRTLVEIGDSSVVTRIFDERSILNREYPMLMGELLLELQRNNKLLELPWCSPSFDWHPITKPIVDKIKLLEPIDALDPELELRFMARVVSQIESDAQGVQLPVSEIEKLTPFIKWALRVPRKPCPVTPCPACGFMSLSKSAGSFEVCSVCNWLDDLVRRTHPLFRFFPCGYSLSDRITEIQKVKIEDLIDRCKRLGIRRERSVNPAKFLGSDSYRITAKEIPALEVCLKLLK